MTSWNCVNIKKEEKELLNKADRAEEKEASEEPQIAQVVENIAVITIDGASEILPPVRQLSVSHNPTLVSPQALRALSVTYMPTPLSDRQRAPSRNFKSTFEENRNVYACSLARSF